MTLPNKKNSLLLAIPVIALMGIIPMIAGDVFAQDSTDKVTDRTQVSNADIAKDRISVANTDVIRDRPISVAPTDRPISDVPERRAEVIFKGGTEGWAIFGGPAFPSEIKMIDGHATYIRNGIWQVKTLGEISAGERDAELELKGKAAYGKLRLHGTGTLDNGEQFRIILRGHYAPISGEPGDFVVAFSMAKIQNLETGVRIPLIQHGIVHVEAADPATDDYEKFLETFDEAN